MGLTEGQNLKFLADGTSVAMIERDDGRFLEGQVDAQLGLLGGGTTYPNAQRAIA